MSEVVYRAAGRHVIHTERECVYLREAKRVVECDPETVDGRKCRGCQGTEHRHDSQDHSLNSKLHELAQSDEDVILTDGGREESMPETLRLTDDGLETPKHLVGATGHVKIVKPSISMTQHYIGDGVPEFSELTVFPPTKKSKTGVPKGHVRIGGTMYEIQDCRTVSECPKCGSDSVSEREEEYKCYSCDHTFNPDDPEIVTDGGLDAGRDTVRMPARLDRELDRLVREGWYDSRSEVLRAGARLVCGRIREMETGGDTDR